MLRVAWRCHSPYVWGRHIRTARKAVIDFHAISRVCKDGYAEGWKPFHCVLLRAVDELLKQFRISDDTWSSLLEVYSLKQVMDLVFTVGGYQLTAMATNTFGVEPEAGDEPLPHA